MIIAILLGAAGFVYALIRILNADQDASEAAGNLSRAYRAGKWSREVDRRLINNLTDPREAAAVLMVQVAQYEGELSSDQHHLILQLMEREFSISSQEADEFYGFARLAVGQINDAANSLAKIIVPIKSNLSSREKEQFVQMMHAVAECDGEPSDRQRSLLMQVMRHLLGR